MGKKSVEKRKEERFCAYMLNQECVRRNAAYQKAYDQWHSMADSEKKYAMALHLCKNWGLRPSVTCPPNPRDLSLVDHLLDRAQKNLGYTEVFIDLGGVPKTNLFERAVEMDVFMNSRLRNLFRARKKFEGVGIFIAFPEKQVQPINFGVVDMRRPKHEVQEIVNGWVEKCVRDRQNVKLKQHHSPTRTRFIDGLLKLKVYDRVQEKNRLIDIALEPWFPKGGEGEKKARLYYSQAKKMVAQPPFIKIYEDFQKRLEEEKKERNLFVPQEIPKTILPWSDVELTSPASTPVKVKNKKGNVKIKKYWFGM
ncbi:MAG: hypothetical protein AB7T38_18615 [Nitrospirales bacterium]